MVLQVVTARQYDSTSIIPTFSNFDNNPLHKFTKCVIQQTNKISEPTTRFTTYIFSPKRFAQQGFGPRELHSSLVKSDCQHPVSSIAPDAVGASSLKYMTPIY